MNIRVRFTELQNVLKILVGNILLGVAYAKWMKPDGIINGGVTSLAMILEKLVHLPIIYLTIIISAILLVVSWVFLGQGNFFKSILSTVFYNAFFSLFYTWGQSLHVNLLVDFVLASIFIAIGYYCCITSDASTVGMDVIAMVLNKKYPDFKIEHGIRYMNIIVLLLGLATYGIASIVIGIAFSICNSYILGYLLKIHNEK